MKYNKIPFLKTDKNGRTICIHELNNVQFYKDCSFYPSCKIEKNGLTFHPINEKIMSLQAVKQIGEGLKQNLLQVTRVENNPVFYFIYNTENYYHFLYDAVPYIHSFFFLKERIPELKLLMNFRSPDVKSFYPFVSELLSLLGVGEEEILIVDETVSYSTMYVSDSYTHGENSNAPPRDEIYSIYEGLSKKFKNNKNFPKKIYVSRRTWLHNDFSNIGTNYTTRRKLENEDELVEILIKKGYSEVFTEHMSTPDKISMFSSATNVIGSIGGGISNCLFSGDDCHLIAIISPTFLDVNGRFRYCFNRVKTTYFTDTQHTEAGQYKKYMRVQSGDLIGEIEEIYEDKLLVYFSKIPVAGWNYERQYERILLNKRDCVALDSGLNSPWKIDIDELTKIIS